MKIFRFFLLVVNCLVLPPADAAEVTLTASTEAVVQGGTSAGIDVDEMAAGYLHVKYNAPLTLARKAYFQFDLGGASPDLDGPATFTIFFKNSYQQRIQLWGLNEAYPAITSGITWSNAQANDTSSNRLLTNGTHSARMIGTNVLAPSSGTTPFSFIIPRLGDFCFGGRISLVLTAEDDEMNNAAGMRLLTNSSSLRFSGQSNTSNDAPYDVYLVGGQSNMDGRGYTSDLTGTKSIWATAQTNAMIYYANPVNTDPVAPTYNTGWQTLAPGFCVPPGFSGPLPSARFGPEIAFAKTLSQSGQSYNRIALIKVTQGGTSLSGDWRPSTGYMYATLTNIVRVGLQHLKENGDTYTLRGMIWHQGESDTSGSAATNYQSNLTQLITSVRRDLGITNLPFVIGEIATNKTVTIRQAQFDIAQTVPFVGFASADGLQTADGTHFTSDGVLTLGKRFAEALETPPFRMEIGASEPSKLQLTVHGLGKSRFQLLSSTNLSAPLSGWDTVSVGSIPGSGQLEITHSIAGMSDARFYILKGE